jgi:hypothetical protein
LDTERIVEVWLIYKSANCVDVPTLLFLKRILLEKEENVSLASAGFGSPGPRVEIACL